MAANDGDQYDEEWRVSGSESGSRSAERWRPVTHSRTYELVLDQIEEQILSGGLRVGDRLPPERELAEALNVSRATVREAIRALEVQGVVQPAVGRGPDAGTTVVALTSQALTRLLRVHVGLANFPIGDIVETRVMLERWSVQLAAEHATEADFESLREILADMDDPRVDRAGFNHLDTAFHVAIAVAGGNRLVADLTTAIRGSLRYALLASFMEARDWEMVVAGLRADHRDIYDLLLAREGSVAADRVEKHIRDFSVHLNLIA